MKIMMAADTYPPDINGAAQFTQRIAQGLSRRGHEVHMVVPSVTGRRADQTDDEDVVVHRVASLTYPWAKGFHIAIPSAARRDVARLLDQVQPDVAHCQAHFVCGRQLARQSRQVGVPLVVTNHFMPENLVDPLPLPNRVGQHLAGWAWRDFGHVCGRADHLTAPTPLAVELMERRTGLRGSEAISCGIDPAPYQRAAAQATPHEVPVVMFAGRLEMEKHVDELLRAAALLPDDLPFAVDIIGDGAHRQRLEALAHQLHMDQRVRFRGFVDEAELRQAYGNADVFCMPGTAELQSLVTLESMAAGKPVVAADAVALPHLVHPGENGFLYTPGNIEELGTHLATLLRDPALRRRMGAESSRIAALHAQDRTLDRFEEIYTGLARSRTVLPMPHRERTATTPTAQVRGGRNAA